AAAAAPQARPSAGSLMRAGRTGAVQVSEPVTPRVTAPVYEYSLTVTGVSQQNNEIADYLAALKQSPLLEGVDLTYIKPTKIEAIELRGFEIVARLRPNADAREVEAVAELRLGEKVYQGPGATENPGPVNQETQKVTDVPESG